MPQRINRAIELLEQDQAIYYVGGHSGHVLTRAQGREDALTWADYINVGMEHGAFDMTGLAEYMAGLVEGGPTRSGHRTPTVIVEAPVNGTDAANVRFNAWQFRQILGRGVHGVLLCQAESAEAVRAFVESCRYPHHRAGVDPALPSPLERWRGGEWRAWYRHPRPRLRSDRGADLGSLSRGLHRPLRALAAQSRRRIAAWGQARIAGGDRQLRSHSGRAGARFCRTGSGRPWPFARLCVRPAPPLPAGDARGARARIRRLPQKSDRVSRNRRARDHPASAR